MMDTHDMKLEADGLRVPDKASLNGLVGGIDKVVGEVKSVLDFVTKYGSFIPGAGAVIGPLQLLDKSLGIVKALLDHVAH